MPSSTTVLLLVLPWHSFCLSQDSTCPPLQPCVAATFCDQKLLQGQEKTRLRNATKCNKEEEKICCPLPLATCPVGIECVAIKECRAHQENLEELRKLGRGSQCYLDRREELRNSTIMCGEEGGMKVVCCPMVQVKTIQQSRKYGFHANQHTLFGCY